MATRTWIGGAEAVQQVTTVTVGGTLSGENFTISAEHPSGSVGNVVPIASHTDSDTSTESAATALAAAWNASNHPYATAVSASASGSVITFTAKTAGVPFLLTLNTPGGSATFSQSTTTDNIGPNDWNTPGNWAEGAVPTDGDDVIIKGRYSILYGLEPNPTITSLHALDYSGSIGTSEAPLRVRLNGECKIDSLKAKAYIEFKDVVGEVELTIVRIMAGTSPTGVFGFANTISKCNICQGNILLGGYLGSTGTLTSVDVHGGDVMIQNDDGAFTTLKVFGGRVETQGQIAPTEVRQTGGTYIVSGSGVPTTCHISGGSFIPNAAGTYTTINGNGGLIDCTKSNESRTFSTLNMQQACTLRRDLNNLTITTLNESGPFQVSGYGAPATFSRR